MRQRSIGSLSVSIIGLGCNQFGRKIDERQSAEVVSAALDAGVTFFDTADRYGYGDFPFSAPGRSEEFLGKALRGRRQDVVIATKFGNPMGDDPRQRGGKRWWVVRAVEDSLRRLGTDYIDIYQMHRPDAATPISETLDALNDLVRQGKVREVGVSNFTVKQVQDAVEAAREMGKGFVSVQNEYSLLHRDDEADVLPFCREHGIAFLPYFPLAGGLLTGKYRPGEGAPENSRLALYPPGRPHLGLSETNMTKVRRLERFASDNGHTLLDLAFAWLLAHDGVISITAGATSPEQITANVAAGAWQLTDAERAEVDALTADT